MTVSGKIHTASIVMSLCQLDIIRQTRSSAIAETARVTIRSVITVDRLTVTVNMTYVNFISITKLSIRGILYAVMSC